MSCVVVAVELVWLVVVGENLIELVDLCRRRILVVVAEQPKQRAAQVPPQGRFYLTDALERLVQLYADWGKREQADAWRRELEAHKQRGKEKKEKEKGTAGKG